MININPIPLTVAKVTSSTSPSLNSNVVYGAVETAWVSGTFAVNDIRAVVAMGRLYSCLVAGSRTISPELDPTNWLDVGPTLKMAMFDLYRNSQTVGASPHKVVVTPGKRIDSVALFGIDAQSALIEMKVGATVVYSVTKNLNRRVTSSWSEYYFGEFSTAPSLLLTDLPPFTAATVEITLTSSTGTVKCGSVAVGSAIFLGNIANGTGDDLNFSTISRDTFGNVTLIPKRSVPKTNQTLLSSLNLINKLREVKRNTNAVPAVWCGVINASSPMFEMFLILGIWKTFSIDPNDKNFAKTTLELEEL
jgi:hypothetical protein